MHLSSNKLQKTSNVVRTSLTHLAIASSVTFLFLPHFDVICDLLLNRCTATWNLSVKVGVVNGKCETLRDGKTSGFLCKPETFL